MPETRHHSAKWHACWEAVQEQGHTEESAAAICTAELGEESYEDAATAASEATTVAATRARMRLLSRVAKRHASGRMIIRDHDMWAVHSLSGEWVIKRLPSLDDALAWCDTRFGPGVDAAKAEATAIADGGERVPLSEPAALGALRQVRLVGATGELRVARFEDRDHLVVPVTALMESVIWPVNADEPEFVPAEVLKTAPFGWNGRPCVGPHPMDGKQLASANEPRRIESEAFGNIFNTRYDNKQLLMEGWLDPLKARRIGANAAGVIDRVRNGDPVEVSVGAYVVTALEDGRFNGQRYMRRWLELVPDHLAFLPVGQRGACSVDMGCGTRAAVRHAVSKTGLSRLDDAESQEGDAVAENKWDSRLLTEMRAAVNPDQMSDQDLRAALTEALAKSVMNFLGVEAVYPTDKRVVYVTGDPTGASPMQMFQRHYEAAKKGVTFPEGEPTLVRPVMNFEPVGATMNSKGRRALQDEEEDDAAKKAKEACVSKALKAGKSMAEAQEECADAGAEDEDEEEPTGAAAKDCGCKDAKHARSLAAKAAGKGKGMAHRNAERIRALVENPKSPFADTDVSYLEGLTDDRLVEFEALAVEAKPPAELSEDEYLRIAPESVRAIVTNYKAAQRQHKAELLRSLTGKVNGAYTEAELTAMSVSDLEKLSRVVKIEIPVDYSGVGMPRAAAEATDLSAPPDPWAAALAARKGA